MARKNDEILADLDEMLGDWKKSKVEKNVPKPDEKPADKKEEKTEKKGFFDILFG
jgi:hypothetical protein